MLPTEILRHEHDVVLQMLDAAEHQADLIESTGTVDVVFIQQFVDFAAHFADGCHHLKEERHLFPALAAEGLTPEAGPVAVMLAEHERGRSLVAGLRRDVQAYSEGSRDTAKSLRENLHAYIQLLRQHIWKENNVLFPMADRLLPPDTQARLAEAFEHVEKEELGDGIHERLEQNGERPCRRAPRPYVTPGGVPCVKGDVSWGTPMPG